MGLQHPAFVKVQAATGIDALMTAVGFHLARSSYQRAPVRQGVCVLDLGTSGAWTFDLSSKCMQKGAAIRPELRVITSAKTFIDVWNGKVRVAQAIGRGQIRIIGDGTRLRELCAALS